MAFTVLAIGAFAAFAEVDFAVLVAGAFAAFAEVPFAVLVTGAFAAFTAGALRGSDTLVVSPRTSST